MLKFKQCLHKDIWNLFQCLIIVLGDFKCNFKAKNETFKVFWRKQMKNKCVNKLFERKMDANFASTTHSQISQSEAFQSLGLFDKTIYKYSYAVTETLQVLFTS